MHGIVFIVLHILALKKLMVSIKVITPTKTGIQVGANLLKLLDSSLRGYDSKTQYSSFARSSKLRNTTLLLSNLCKYFTLTVRFNFSRRIVDEEKNVEEVHSIYGLCVIFC